MEDEIAYSSFLLQEARSGLDHQRDVLRYFRTQSMILATVSSLIASFLSPISKDDGTTIGPFVLSDDNFLGDSIGFAMFVLSVLTCAYILLPTKRWVFHASPHAIVSELEEKKEFNTYEVMKTTAFLLDDLAERNARKLDTLNSLLFFATIATIAQIPAWLI